MGHRLAHRQPRARNNEAYLGTRVGAAVGDVDAKRLRTTAVGYRNGICSGRIDLDYLASGTIRPRIRCAEWRG